MTATRCSGCGRPLDVAGVFPGGEVPCACGGRGSAPGPEGLGAGEVATRGGGPYRAPAVRSSEAPRAPEETPAEFCLFCGGGVPASASRCPGCDVRVDRPRCRRCYRLASPGDPDCVRCGAALDPPRRSAPFGEAPCPRCQEGLERTEAEVLECPRCAGTFLSNDALAGLLEQVRSLPPLDDPGPAPPLEGAVRYLACPGCQGRMNRVVFGGASGVVVDVCRTHGTFFDAQELPRAVAWLSRGGLARAEKRRLEREREDLRARRAARALLDAGAPASSWEARTLGRTSHGVADAALDLLVELLFFS